MVGNAKKNWEKKVAKESKEAPKQFYAYLKAERGNKVRIGPIKDSNGCLIVDPIEQANHLNKNYAEVFTRDDGSIAPPIAKKVALGNEISYVHFTEEKVARKMENLRLDAAGGQTVSAQESCGN